MNSESQIPQDPNLRSLRVRVTNERISLRLLTKEDVQDVIE